MKLCVKVNLFLQGLFPQASVCFSWPLQEKADIKLI